MGREVEGPVCRPGTRMVSCWRHEVCKINVQGSPGTQGLDARPGAELAQSSLRQGPGPCSSSFRSSYPHCPAHPSPLLAHPDHCAACFSLVQDLH